MVSLVAVAPFLEVSGLQALHRQERAALQPRQRDMDGIVNLGAGSAIAAAPTPGRDAKGHPFPPARVYSWPEEGQLGACSAFLLPLPSSPPL